MNLLFEKLSTIIASLWVGGLWSMLMVTTILFNKIPSSYIAAAIASDMFTFMNFFGIFSSGFLIIYGFKKVKLLFLRSTAFWILLLMLLLILISYVGVNPVVENLNDSSFIKEMIESVFVDRYSSWYGVVNAAFLIECVLGILLIIKIR